jgi:uncharacterized membrane protein YfcA
MIGAAMWLQDLLAVASGSLVGFVLGLIGGGGSILAVPLLVYVVGVRSPHIAIGTSAIAVAFSALSSLLGHWRAGNVRWPCALLFTVSGVAGATAGSTLGKAVDGQKLLGLFGLLMIVIAIMTVRRKPADADRFRPLGWDNAGTVGLRLALLGLGAGFASGFFGIGGGFLVVPGLIAAAHMPLLEAVGSSLVSVTAFGTTTAANYALSGLVDWRIAGFFIAGGALGSLVGVRAGVRLSKRKQLLVHIFAFAVALVGLSLVVDALRKLVTT